MVPAVQKTDNTFDTVTAPREGQPRFGKVARQKLTEEETSQLLSLTALTLSAFNVNNCRFVLVRDPDLRKQIQKFSFNQSPIPHVSSLIILCADLQHWEKTSGAIGETDSANLTEAAAFRQRFSPQELDQMQRDEAMYSCGIAAQTLMLTAKAMGYDSWRMEGFDYEEVGKLINLPPEFVVAMLLVVGRNIKQSWQNLCQFTFHDLVILDQF